MNTLMISSFGELTIIDALTGLARSETLSESERGPLIEKVLNYWVRVVKKGFAPKTVSDLMTVITSHRPSQSSTEDILTVATLSGLIILDQISSQPIYSIRQRRLSAWSVCGPIGLAVAALGSQVRLGDLLAHTVSTDNMDEDTVKSVQWIRDVMQAVLPLYD